MQRGNFAPNPYSNRGPFTGESNGFRSPTHFQSPPGPTGARFNQQFPPANNSRWQGPSNHHMKSPRRVNSPYNSPHHNSFDCITPGSQVSGHSRSYSSSSAGSFSCYTPTDGRGKSSHRGRFTPGSNNVSPWKFRNFSSPRNDSNSNPGGSNDISLYYSPDMVKDPWANLKPTSVKNTSFSTT